MVGKGKILFKKMKNFTINRKAQRSHFQLPLSPAQNTLGPDCANMPVGADKYHAFAVFLCCLMGW